MWDGPWPVSVAQPGVRGLRVRAVPRDGLRLRISAVRRSDLQSLARATWQNSLGLRISAMWGGLWPVNAALPDARESRVSPVLRSVLGVRVSAATQSGLRV